MHDFSQRFFEPALKNMQRNLGNEIVGGCLLQEVCVNALEHSKAIFKFPKSEINNKEKYLGALKGSLKRKSTSSHESLGHRRLRKKMAHSCFSEKESTTDLILVRLFLLTAKRP
jgi:hypothetical protein